jgi:hypothetical protein
MSHTETNHRDTETQRKMVFLSPCLRISVVQKEWTSP